MSKRRSPGEGGAYEYQTTAGKSWYWKAVITKADGTRETMVRRGFATKQRALEAMGDAQAASRQGTFAEPSRQLLSAYLGEWLEGLRLEPATVANYRILLRCHVLDSSIAALPLASLTAARIDALYRQLEQHGRRDHMGERTGLPLSASTVRHVHVLLRGALAAAVRSGQLVRNPADAAHPPTAKQAKAREMHPWGAGELSAFLAWAREHSSYYTAFHTLAMTGLRRGELLALTWRDVDLDAGTIAVRRSAGSVKVKGERGRVVVGPTKTHRARVVDIDSATVALLRSHRRERAGLALQLASAGAVAFGDHEGRIRVPEHFSAAFADAITRCRKQLAAAGAEPPPVIRLHDLRHTHATLLLADREPVKTVSERLGHASVAITLDVYGHVMPGDQRRAADRFAALIGESR